MIDEQPTRLSILSGHRALILDLDFTLLHLQPVSGSIEVPGRTRSAFLAPATIDALGALQNRFALILATARSWDGTHWVSDGLRSRGVFISAAILEDGALLYSPTQNSALDGPIVPQSARPLEAGRNWPALRGEIEARRQCSWPAFEWQRDFVACLVARAESSEQCARLMDAWAPLLREWNAVGRELRLFRDGRKLYVAGAHADKWAALKYLLGPRAPESAGVGDGANDVCWLGQIAQSCTMAHASAQVLAAVRARGGFVSDADGHAGILQVLRVLLSCPFHSVPELQVLAARPEPTL